MDRKHESLCSQGREATSVTRCENGLRNSNAEGPFVWPREGWNIDVAEYEATFFTASTDCLTLNFVHFSTKTVERVFDDTKKIKNDKAQNTGFQR